MTTDDYKIEGFENEALMAAERLLRFDGEDPPVEPADDISRRRDIKAALELAESISDEDHRDQRRGRPVWPWIAAGIAAAAAAVVVWIAVSPSDDAGVGEPIGSNEIAGAAPAPLPLRVLLAAGEGNDLTESLVDGLQLPAGASIETTSGQAVLGVSNRARIRIAPNSRLELTRASERECELALSTGTLLVSVDPGIAAPQIAVATSAGRVVVKGTVFGVAVTAGETTVEVYRGKVQIVGSSTREIRAGREATLPAGDARPLGQGREQTVLTAARGLDLLDASEMALLEIRSEPSGADVALDGKLLGQTPVVLATRAGHRELALTLDGYSPLRDKLTLDREAMTSRRYPLVVDPYAAGDGSPTGEDFATGPGSTTAGDKPATALTAKELLTRARAFRKNRDWTAAARAYGQLLKAFPASPEARNARVSLGIVQLKHLGQPGRALRSFDAYLGSSGGGALDQEALFGKAKALRALGRTVEEARALEQFVARFPGSLRVKEARQRLAEIGR